MKVEADGDTGGIIPFELWPHLVERAEAWQSGRSEIILKARQIGISTNAEAYADYVAMIRGGNVLVISKSGADSKDFGRKCLIIYDNLPPELQRTIETRNTDEISFVGGGRIILRAPTEHAGRSQANTLVIIDEAAFHPFALTNYKAYQPTISAGGQLLMISTANGASGFFYDRYRSAESGTSPHDALFIGWGVRPDRQVCDLRTHEVIPNSAWLDYQRSAYEGLPGEFQQEFPDDVETAFVAHSGLVFGMDELGTLIFDTSTKNGNIAERPCDWQDAKWRLVGIDPGGRDPNAMIAVAVSPDGGRIHVYGEVCQPGSWPADRYIEWLSMLDKRGKLSAVVVDPSAKLTATFGTYGFPVYDANNDKKRRLNLLTTMFRNRTLTVDPVCTRLLHQLQTYWYVPRKEGSQQSDAVQTRAGAGHHADLIDALGYVIVAIVEGLPQAGGRKREMVYHR